MATFPVKFGCHHLTATFPVKPFDGNLSSYIWVHHWVTEIKNFKTILFKIPFLPQRSRIHSCKMGPTSPPSLLRPHQTRADTLLAMSSLVTSSLFCHHRPLKNMMKAKIKLRKINTVSNKNVFKLIISSMT